MPVVAETTDYSGRYGPSEPGSLVCPLKTSLTTSMCIAVPAVSLLQMTIGQTGDGRKDLRKFGVQEVRHRESAPQT
jgi:hypothetical protein